MARPVIRRPSLKIFSRRSKSVPDQFLDADQPGLHAVFRQLENRRFGAVENHVGVVARRQRLLLNRGRGINQAAQNRLFLHDPRVVLHVRDARQARRPAAKDTRRRPRLRVRRAAARSSISVIVSMACCFSPSCTMRSKMCRCCGRKKSSERSFSTAAFSAWLSSRTAPRMLRSASRLCGSGRSSVVSLAIVCVRFIFA